MRYQSESGGNIACAVRFVDFLATFYTGGQRQAGPRDHLPPPGPWHHINVLQSDAGENHITGESFNSYYVV